MQKLFSTKLQGGILNLVLAVGIVLTAIIGSVLLLVYHRNLVLTKNSLQERLNRNAASGINYLLAAAEEEIEHFGVDLYGEGLDSVRLSKEAWGIFDLAITQAKTGRHEAYRIALLGAGLDSMREVALYLADEDRPLLLADKVTIVGKAFVPQAELKQVHLGQGEMAQPNKPLVKGALLKSKAMLPPLYKKALARADRYTNFKYPAAARVVPFTSAVGARQVLTASFLEETTVLASREQVVLQDVSLSGHLVVVSEQRVHIGRSAKLENIIVAAPYIEVAEGFSGSVQLFARDSISIGESCRLLYPSALYVSDGAGAGKLWIGSGAEITGEVLLGDEEGKGSNHLLSLQEDALIRGQVFVDGAVELYGAIEGSLMCRRFLLKTPAALYANYLQDASVRVDALSKHYLASPLVSTKAKKGIVAWLR